MSRLRRVRPREAPEEKLRSKIYVGATARARPVNDVVPVLSRFYGIG